MNLTYPVKNPRITQKFGENLNPFYKQQGLNGHMGLDLGCPIGTEVYAAHDGYLNFQEDPGGYGHEAHITVQGQYWTIYGHLSQFVGSDRNVKQGELIAYSGNSGMSTGPHLHFGLVIIPFNRNNGYLGCSDPLPFLSTNTNHMPQIKTVNIRGEEGILLAAATPEEFNTLCKVFGKDSSQIEETI